MTDTTIDKLIFALGGDLTALNKAYAEAEVGAQKTGTSIKANLGTGFKEAADAATQHSATLKRAMGEVDTAVKNTHGSTATATREFRALFDELSSGRTRQTPGTLAIIATRVFGISGATLAWSAALAAIPVAFAVAAFQAQSALARVDDALKRTGNKAGITRDQILSIAQAGIPGLSERGALDSLGILSSRANIAPNLLAGAARAVPGYARATGTDQDKASEALEKLLTDPAKGAAQLNEEFKLLDLVTTREIEHLEAAGRTSEAQALLVKGLNDRFDGLAKSSWSLASSFSSFGQGLSNFWFKTGTFFTGADQTDKQKLAALQTQLAGAQAYRDRYGSFGPGSNEDVSAALKNLPGQIAALQTKVAKDAADAAAGRAHANSNSAVGFGLKIAEGYDEQADKAKKLTEQLSALNIAIGNATGPNAKFREELTRERDAVQTALAHQMTPAQIAAQAASDQRRIAAAAPGQARDTLQAQIAAQREFERNQSDPRTAPYAKAIFDSQMSVAGISNKDLSAQEAARKKAQAEADRMKKNLDEAVAQAEGEEKLAAAYDESTQAVVRAKAAGEAHDQFVKKNISDEAAYTAALLRRAFATEQASVSQKHLDEQQNIAGLGRVGAAGGNPAAIARANEQNAALAATAKEFAAATTMTETLRAQADYRRALSDEEAKDAANRLISANKEDQSLSDNIEMAKALQAIKYEDAGLRAKEIADLETEQELRDAGYEKGTAAYTAEYQRRSSLKEAAAALGATSDGDQLYARFRDGLSSVLESGTNGFKSLGDAAGNFLKQLAQMTVQLYLFAPLMNAALGTSSSGGGGIFGSLLGSLLGSVGINTTLGIGNVASTPINAAFGGGRASGGNIDPGKFYVVGENGPEILGGVGGHITPISPPNQAGSGGGGGGTLNTNVTATIAVQGTGDKELMATMEAGARHIVTEGIKANNKVLARTQRSQLLSTNRRALP